MSERKLWSGRFSAPTASLVESFTESVSFDWRLWRYDIQGSLAHADALHAAGLITQAERDAMVQGLKQIEREIESGQLQPKPELEDVHMNIEAALIERIGDAGKKLHTARSRNDQIALDMRLWARDAAAELRRALRGAQAALVALAESEGDAVMPAFTHLQHAQPVLAAHYLLAHVEALERDRERLADCLKRLNALPLGACAIAGSALPVDRRLVAEKLGFDRVTANSIDAVSDRGHLCELAFCCAMVMAHLSRWAEDWVLWSSAEFGFIDIDDAYCTGSSMMPQKKNPDAAELVRGKTGRVFGDLTALLVLLKAAPTGYNRDFQEDKPAVFDAMDTALASARMAAAVIEHTHFRRGRLETAAEQGHMDATALADYLVRRGVPFRQAHEIVGRLVAQAIARGCALAELPLDVLRRECDAIGEDVYDGLGPRRYVEAYQTLGSSQPAMVARQIEAWRKRLEQPD